MSFDTYNLYSKQSGAGSKLLSIMENNKNLIISLNACGLVILPCIFLHCIKPLTTPLWYSTQSRPLSETPCIKDIEDIFLCFPSSISFFTNK